LKPITKIAVVDPLRPPSDTLERAAAAVRQGGLVVFPTTGLYGLGADPLNPEAVERIFRLKARDADKPLLVLIDQLAMMNRVAQPVSAMARHLMARFWPGRLTFVVRALPNLPAGLTAGSGKIGVRLTGHPVAAALAGAAGGLLIGTSANISGAGGIAVIPDLDPSVLESVAMVLDAGPLTGQASTVVDVTAEAPVILRQGAVPGAAIMSAIRGFDPKTEG
jgi:L-threonylcarbamoyladenylate synthase